MKLLLKAIDILLVIKLVKCSIVGLAYTDLQNIKKMYNTIPKGEDPCNPLYWYPRNIPEYCYFKNIPKTEKPRTEPIPMPIPVPLFPKPVIPAAIVPPPPPVFPAPVPVGMPIAPPMMPMNSGVPYPMPNPVSPNFLPFHTFPSPYGSQQQAGMVPGISGIVTRDGGINILPFSDAYSDMLEKHKQKMIRRKLQRVLDDYEDYPKHYNKLRKRLRNAYID